MADYSKAKGTPGGLSHEGVTESALRRVEPLVTPSQVRLRHLFGIPLVSMTRDPLTGKQMVMGDDLVKDVIDRAIAMVEQETHLDIFPNEITEKLEFDRFAFASFGYMSVRRRPVHAIQDIRIMPANGVSIYTMPLDWVETANLYKGQISVVPMGSYITAGGVTSDGTIGGTAFLSVMSGWGWIPAYWQVKYSTGFPDGMIPKIINEAIGAKAAMEILSMLAATNAKATSRSLGIDGLSQSIGSPGPDMFKSRMDEIGQKYALIVKKLKAAYGTNLFSTHL